MNINLDELNRGLSQLDRDFKQLFQETHEKTDSVKSEVETNLDKLNQDLTKLDRDLKQFFKDNKEQSNSAKADSTTANIIKDLKQRVFELHGIAFTLKSKASELKIKIESGQDRALELDNLAIQVVELKLDIDDLRTEIHKL